MVQIGLKPAVVILVAFTVSGAAVRIGPTLTFRVVSGEGAGIETPVTIWTEPQALVIRGKMVLSDGCQGLRGRLTKAARDTIELTLESYRKDHEAGVEILCPRTELPTRYEARIAPLEGPWHIRVSYRGDPNPLADLRVYLPRAE